MANLPTFGRNDGTVVIREGEVPLADFDDGCNLPASCAPGVGINIGGTDPKVSDWTDNDQFGALRTPQQSSHIGANGLEGGIEGNSSGDHAVTVADHLAADFKDTAQFIGRLWTAVTPIV